MEALIFGITLVIVYGILFYTNTNTPRPEGCELVEGGCASCADSACDLKG